MPEQREGRVRALFDQAAELPRAERDAFLDAACSGDDDLRAAVEGLLVYDAGSGIREDDEGLLKSPVIRPPKVTLADDSIPRHSESPGLPARIGRYCILRRHGEGGMATVYEAEQDQPRRTVALKVIRPGLVTLEFVKRFRHEAEILARLQHPGIVQIYEAGVADDGRPFFAMEFIRGLPLDRYAYSRHLDVPARLELLARVCDAVQHAHDTGVIHRDLKPSNILVDESGQPRVLDFGVARITDPDLLLTASETRTGELLGTLSYMSPEQFSAHPSTLDARSDVYTLGVILYELLAERLPYQLDQLPVHEVARVIEQEEPPRLSSIDKLYRGDVEVIVARALEKARTRRYARAADLASDIRRHLRREAILARKVSGAERFWRWVRRNPSIAALMGVLIGVLMLATASSLVAARRFYTIASARDVERLAADRVRLKETAARLKADEANARLRTAQETLFRTVYATRSNLALVAWDADDVGQLRALLNLLRPAPGEEDRRGWEWRYLWQLGHEARLALPAQKDIFLDVAFSPDGQTLAGLEHGGRIQIWDRQTGQLRQTTGAKNGGPLADLNRGVHAIAFSPDGRSLAGPGEGASLVLYAADTGLPIRRLEGPPGALLSLTWSPDGGNLVAGLARHALRVWDAHDGHLIHETFGRHGGPVAAVAYSPDGRTLASGSFDRTLKLWNPGDPTQPRAVLTGHSAEVRAVAFSPDGRQIASASNDRSIRIWDAASGAGRAVIWGHAGMVPSLAYGPDSATIVSGSADETVRVWDTRSGQELRAYKGHDDRVIAVAVSPEGGEIASASVDRTVRVWNAASPPHPRTLEAPRVLTFGGNAECLAFSPDGRSLVSGHDDQVLRLWDLASGRLLRVSPGHTSVIKCVTFSPDGRTIASASEDHTVRLWDADSGAPRLTFTGHTAFLRSVVFAPDGQTVFSGSHDKTIQAWDPATGVVRYILRGHSDSVHDLAFSPDGHTLASASWDKTCVLWDLATRRPRVTLRHGARLNTVGYSADGRTIATSAHDNTIRLWDAADGSLLRILEGHIDSVDGLAFSPDGRLASSSVDKTIRLWDPASGQSLLTLKGHAGRVRCVKFSPDGRTLASASHDRTVKLWEAAPAAVLATPRP
jgi:WD40 repeat protein